MNPIYVKNQRRNVLHKHRIPQTAPVHCPNARNLLGQSGTVAFASSSSEHTTTSESMRFFGFSKSCALIVWKAATTRDSGKTPRASMAADPTSMGRNVAPSASNPSGTTVVTTIFPDSASASDSSNGRWPSYGTVTNTVIRPGRDILVPPCLNRRPLGPR